MEDNLSKSIENHKPVRAFPFIFSGLPLIIYPSVFIASLMSLGGQSTGNEPALLILVVKSFLWASLLYPATYILCLVSFFVTKNETRKRLLLKFPYFHLILCVILFFLWMSFGGLD